MSRERNDTFKASETPQLPAAERSDEQRHATAVERFLRIGFLATALGVVVTVADYFYTGVWQSLFDAASFFLAMVLLIAAQRLVRRKQFRAAGYWILGAMVIVIGAGELVWEGETTLSIIAGILLIFITTRMVLPGRWVVGLIMVVLYVLYILGVNWLEPLSRYDVTLLPGRILLDWIAALLLLVIISWQMISVYRNLTTIRVRLLVAFVIIVLLLVVSISVVSVVLSFQRGQEQVMAQLESVATLRENAIKTWAHRLEENLLVIVSGQRIAENVILAIREPVGSLEYQRAYNALSGRLQWAMEELDLFDRIFILNLQGRVILSTHTAQLGENHGNEVYFQQGRLGFYLQPLTYSISEGRELVVVAQPIRNEQDEVMAVLVGWANLGVLNEIMLEQHGLGGTGETYLVNINFVPLTELALGENVISVRTSGTRAAIEGQTSGSDVYEGYYGGTVIGVYRWLPELRMALLAEQNRDESLSGTEMTARQTVAIILIGLVVTVAISMVFARNISNPIVRLTETVAQISAGNLDLVAKVEREDEVGTLARAVNDMTAQLNFLVGSLEQRVDDRTRELERRSAYLEAASEVGRAASSVLDPGRLMWRATELIRERFGLYHVGIALMDETGRWADYQAGAGPGAQSLLDDGLRMQLGGGSLVGWCMEHSRARVAQDVLLDPMYLSHPLIPDTRSEAALPLIARGQVIGALSVQSDQRDTFTPDTVAALQVVADQVAVALDNAQLLKASQEALEAERRAYGEVSREAWMELLGSRVGLGYDYTQNALIPDQRDWSPEMVRAAKTGRPVQGESGDDLTLAMPIKVRDQIVGVLNFCKSEMGDTLPVSSSDHWTLEEITVLETLTEELGQALESAQLYRETQDRAARERLAGEVTARMRETLNVDAVLQTAAQEMRQILNLSEVEVRLGTGSTSDGS